MSTKNMVRSTHNGFLSISYWYMGYYRKDDYLCW